ncbi:BLUF domain-containing protein [Gilvimarinus algae]|uniref:BLUF domain-containing protein n=1 Tax=Gilvimarinus algae TaxID=3058037 RepID=A0ABT8TJ51_9GAMM|nr:BLUF domain-containing protein [Gilvimarinus sp. SDUM040014]MDO3383961.1 BLUF domain-containing protein [Gilvimarinus sp. SDUM040014]
MLKRIACLSSIDGPDNNNRYSEQVFNTFDTARVYNKEHDIVGVFLVFKNILLQVAEGEANELAKVIYRINRDPRISDVSIIVNEHIEKPAFSRWSIKLLSENCDAHAQHLKKIENLLKGGLNLSGAIDSIRYHKLFNMGETSAPTSKQQIDSHEQSAPFRDTVLSMPSWPRPTQLRLDAALMKLCPLLIKKHVPYQRLVSLNLFAHEQELTELLHRLQQARALEVIAVAEPDNLRILSSQRENKAPAPARGRFSQALRSFISNHRAKGIAGHE